MLQKKESSGRENLSIEEYLVRRKNIREESPTGRQGLIHIIFYLYHLFSRRGRREYMHRERPER